MSFARVDRLLAADRWREALDALDDLETRAPGPLAPVTSAEASARRLAALRHLGDLETAADLARAVIVRARAAGWMHVLQTALRERALCLVELGDAPAAVRLAEEAADLAETAGDLAGLGLAFLAIGDARARWIGPGQAVDSWQAAADTLRVAGTGEPTKSASNAPLSIPLTRLGEQAHREGRLEEARALLDEALAHARGAPLAEAGARWSLAMLLEEQARRGASGEPGTSPAAARIELERALALFRQVGQRRGVARALNALGEHARRAGRLAEADQRYTEALAQVPASDPFAEAYRLNRALVALAAGDTAAALKGAAGHEQATDPSWAAVAASVRLAAGSTITGARSWDAAERAVRHAIEVRGVVDRDLADCLVRAAADSDADRAARAADLALGQLLLRGSDDELQAIRRRLRLLGGAGAAIPLGPWSLRRPLASGGAGQVWEATHRDRGTAVAVKLLPPEVLASPALRATLTTEIRAVAALNHPNVIAVLDQGRVGAGAAVMSAGQLTEGSPYLVMELARGGNLLPECGRLAWADVAPILDALLGALAAAHARGLIHRDLKPDNVLVDHPDDLRPGLKLTDFGLALALGEVDARVAGTPSYMAPEQCRGAWRAIGPWTDLYALGCTAWALLTGGPPFEGELRRVLLRQLHETPGAFRPVRAVPEGVEPWLRRLLAKRPVDRFAYAAEARAALRALAPRGRRSGAEARPPAVRGQTTSLVGIPRDDAPAGARPPATLTTLPDEWAEPETRFPRALAGLDTWALREIPIVGRVAERDRLWGLLGERRPRVAVLHGPAGMGKTRLAEWLRVRAHELAAAEVITIEDGDLPSAFARAWRLHGLSGSALAQAVTAAGLTGELAQAVVDLLDAGGEADDPGRPPPTGPEDRSTPAAPVMRTLATTVLTSARTLTHTDTPPDEDHGEIEATGQSTRHIRPARPLPAAERPAVLAAALRALARGRPVVLVFEDAGPPEAEMVRRLVDHADLWLLALLTSRSPVALPRAVEIELGPLSDEELRTLVQSRLPLEEGLARTLAKRAAGSPGAAVSILDRLVRGGALEPRGEGLALRPGATVVAPTSDARWDDALAAVGRLGADAVTAFDLLAVLGSATSAEWVAARRTAGVRGPHDLEELLARSEMIRERRGRWELTDPGLRDRVMHLRVSQLQDLHLICSRVIHDPGRRGVHLVGAGRLDEGASLLLDAARSAEVANEPFDTLDLAATALDALDRLPAGEADPRRAQVALLQARAHIELGHPDAVLAAVAVLVAGAENAGWEAAVADGLRCRARVLRTQGRLDEAEAAFGLALEAAELAGEPALAGHALLGRALVERSRGRLDEALATLAEASRRLPEGEQAQIALTIGAIRMQQGAAGDARRWLERAAAAASLVGSRSTLAQATNVLAELDRREGDLDAAELGYQQALRLLELSGARAQTIFPRLNLALLGFARERWRDARTQLLDVLADVEDQGRDGLAGACHAMLLAPAVALGDPVAFDRHATLALERLRRTGFREPDTLASLRLALALTSDPDQRRRCRELVATQE